MPYTEDQLRQAVDAVFNQFDADKSGFLDSNEVMALINTALQHMKANRQASQKEVNDLVAAVDKNGDGKIAKPELLEIFKRVANQWTHDLWKSLSLYIFFSSNLIIQLYCDKINKKYHINKVNNFAMI